MAFLARHRGVQSDQRELRQIVIETDLLAPLRFVVTGFAGRAELTLVWVVGLMTGNARGAQFVLEKIALMAAFAFDLLVRAVERELGGLGVVEADGLPF